MRAVLPGRSTTQNIEQVGMDLAKLLRRASQSGFVTLIVEQE